ncbi:30S ribosomal protein S2 [bacterium]|nr:30S ribosomal protein S2 [bacterium]
MIDYRELVRLGAHFGHIKRRLHPKMNCYIWGCRNNVHLFDVSKTARQVETAAKFLESVAAQQKTILWVGTKKPARDAVFAIADKLKMPYVNHRWIGGTLSNFSQVRKSVTKLLHYEDILEKSANSSHYTKKELNSFSKLVDRLKNNIGGIKDLAWPIGAIVMVDALKEGAALREAVTVGIPVVSLVDTNTDPSLVNYVIPINDDSARVITFVMDYLSESVVKGQKKAKELVIKKKEDQEVKRAKIKVEGGFKKPAVRFSKDNRKAAPKAKVVQKKVVAPKVSTEKKVVAPKVPTEKKVVAPKVPTEKKVVAPKVSTEKKVVAPKASTEKKVVAPKASTEKKKDVTKKVAATAPEKKESKK